MAIRFIGQPFAEAGQIGATVSDALRDPRSSHLWIATAWAKRSGLGRIRRAAIAFRERGGSSEVIVGIDEGGATREGLTLCLELFDDVFVYQDPGSRTFHPKIYGVEGDEWSQVIVGSGNLTKGGLFTNYEAALVIDTEPAGPEWHLHDEIRRYFDMLLAGGDAIRRLDDGLITRLSEEGWVTSEARQNRRRSAESRDRRARERLFGPPPGSFAGAPASDLEPLPAEDEDEDSALPPATTAVIDAEDAGIRRDDEAEGGEPPEVESAPSEGFWKRLSNWDASGSSAPGQIQIPIQFLEFFPTLSDEIALTEGLGAGQSAAYFPLEVRDGTFTKDVSQARVILYEPAPHHPRPNRELRVTFHDHEVFERLSPLDILVFTQTGGTYRVERLDPGAMDGRWGWLE